jgi:putative SOS response-associated peptidase YedK
MRPEKKVSVYAKNSAGEVIVKEMHWGLIPPSYQGYLSEWGASTNHARLETVATLPAFEHAWARKRRVIFPMECYYEKTSLGKDLMGRKGKAERVAILRADSKPMGVAGIYDHANLMDGPILSAAMLTREAGTRMARFHDREPVILDPEDWQAWLDGTDDLDLTTPWDDDAFQVLPAAAMKGRQKARAGTQ